MMNTAILTRVIIRAVPHCNTDKSECHLAQINDCYLEFRHPSTVLNNNSNPIDDDLHEKLDFEYPENEDAEE